jgi:hypothetical protein
MEGDIDDVLRGYVEMVSDPVREAEAMEWCEALIADGIEEEQFEWG